MIYTTGSRGFLLSNFFKKYKYTDYEEITKNYEIVKTNFKNNQILMDFGCKTLDNYNYSLQQSLYNTYKLVEICKNYNLKYIFASSYGVLNAKTPYDHVKIIQENIIKSLNNYLIIRIPRIYDSSRNAGLINFLKNNEIYDDKKLEYCDLNFFCEQLNNGFNKSGIINLNVNHCDLISVIKDKYVNNFNSNS